MRTLITATHRLLMRDDHGPRLALSRDDALMLPPRQRSFPSTKLAMLHWRSPLSALGASCNRKSL
jgi:hypothetical protein